MAAPSPAPSQPNPASRVFKPKTPISLIVKLALIMLLLLGGIFYAINHFQKDFMAARMPGTIIEKKFVPNPREEVVLDNRGNMRVRQLDGDYSLLVRVPQANGETRDILVSNVPKAMFESVEVGQRFDVGPYLLPPSALVDPVAANPSPSPSPAVDAASTAPADTSAAAPEPAPAAEPSAQEEGAQTP